jgi:hypothetical protein
MLKNSNLEDQEDDGRLTKMDFRERLRMGGG